MVHCCRMRHLRILRLTGVAATATMIFGSETPVGPAAASPIELRSAGAIPYPIDVVFVHGFLDMKSTPPSFDPSPGPNGFLCLLVLWPFRSFSPFLVHLVLTIGSLPQKDKQIPSIEQKKNRGSNQGCTDSF